MSGGLVDHEVLDGHGRACGQYDAVVGDGAHLQTAERGDGVFADDHCGFGGAGDRAVADPVGTAARRVDAVGSRVTDRAPVDLGNALVIDDHTARTDVLDDAVLEDAGTGGGDDDPRSDRAADRAAAEGEGPVASGEHGRPGGPFDLAVGQFDLSGRRVDHRSFRVASPQDQPVELDRFGHRRHCGPGGRQDLDGPGRRLQPANSIRAERPSTIRAAAVTNRVVRGAGDPGTGVVVSFDPKRGRLRAGASVCALTLFLVPGAPASADEVVPPALPQVVPELSSDTCVSASEEVIDQEVWTENALGLPYARTTSSGEGTNVAVLGSGVDDTPAALAGAVAEGGEDCTGFGTFLAGVVAARPQSDSGLVGVAPEARVTAVPVTDERGRSDADALAEGMTEAVSEGADVVLVGVALPIGSSDLDAAVDTAEAENVLVVAPSTARVQSEVHAAAPATRSEVLGVVANGTDGSVHGEAPTEDGGEHRCARSLDPGGSRSERGPRRRRTRRRRR